MARLAICYFSMKVLVFAEPMHIQYLKLLLTAEAITIIQMQTSINHQVLHSSLTVLNERAGTSWQFSGIPHTYACR